MKIKKTKFGEPDIVFINGIDGKAPCPFSEIEFLKTKIGDETSLQKLGSEEYNSILDSIEEKGLLTFPLLMNSINRIMNFENSNKEKLEELAVDTVVKNFGLPDEIRELLEAKLDCESDLDCSPQDEDDEEEFELNENELEIANELIKKRIIQNALMMGCGYRAHKLFLGLKESLDEIDDRLYPLYENFLPSVEFYLWKQELPPNQRVNWGKCEIVEENGSIKGVAKAKTFIILLHEVAKIAVELLFLQSIQDIHDLHGESVKRYVIKKADRYEDEQWMKLIGPRLWKRLHDCLIYVVKSKGNNYTIISYLLNAIGILYPENFFLVMDTVVNDGEKAVKLLDETYEEILREIELFSAQQEDYQTKTNSKRARKKRNRTISDCTLDELYHLLNEAVENEEFEKAAVIKREIDNR